MRVADHFLVRVAGLAMEALAAMDCPWTLAATQRLEALRAELDNVRPGLCDRLFHTISGQTDTRLRRMLLELKRAIFNDRTPAVPVAQLRTVLTDSRLLRDLLAWEDCMTRYLQLLQEGQETATHELATVADRLRQSWLDPSFQTGLLMAQPLLYQRLQEFLKDKQSRDHRLEGSALAYFLRATTKTSPFSTFTATGFGQFGIGETSFVAAAPLTIASQFALNTTVSDRLAQAIRLHAKSPAHLPLKTNEAVYTEPEKLLFLRTGAPTLDATRMLGVKESVMSIKRNALVDAVLALLVDPDYLLTARALVTRLHETWNGAIGLDKLISVVQQLITSGFLQFSLSHNSNNLHALRQLAACLTGWDDPTARQWAEQMVSVEDALQHLPDQPPSAKAQTLDAIAKTTQHLFAQLTPSPPAVGAQGLVHHDCYVVDPFVLDSARMAAPLQDLADLTQVMPLFNLQYSLDELTSQFFRDTYGPRTTVPLLHFFRDFHEQHGGVLQLGERKSNATDVSTPGMAKLLRLREQFISRVQAATQGQQGVEVHLPPDMIREFAMLAAPFRPQGIPFCVGYFGHLANPGQPDTSLVFVLNQVVAGYGHYMARFINSPGQGEIPGQRFALERLRADFARLEQDGYEAVEVLGTFGFNGQIHPRMTRRYLAYPGEAVTADPTNRIAWRDLAVTCDGNSQALHLVWQPDGRRVLPVNLSPAAPQIMPPFFRFVISLGLSFRPSFSLLDLLEAQVVPEDRQQVRRYPRICFGQIVLSRQTWCIPSEHLPAATERPTEYAYFRTLRAWARQLGLPRRVFVTPERLTDYLQSDKPAHNPRRVYKPFYVDFDNPLSCQTFRRFTEGMSSTLTISEMLPGPEQMVLRRADRHYVSELLLEFYDERG